MKISLKEHELSSWLFAQLKKKFPEIRFAGVVESADDDALWVKIVEPKGEERLLELIRYSSRLSSEILDEYGYHITTFPASEEKAKKPERTTSPQKRVLARTKKIAFAR